jgi:hypothetical protein
VTLLRDAPFAGIYFTTYEVMKRKTKNISLVPVQHLISGATAGAIATTCTIRFVFDFLKLLKVLMLLKQDYKHNQDWVQTSTTELQMHSNKFTNKKESKD